MKPVLGQFYYEINEIFSEKFCASPAYSTVESYSNPSLLSIFTATTNDQSTIISHHLASQRGHYEAELQLTHNGQQG